KNHFPPDLKRRQFLKGIGLMGAGVGAVMADEFLLHPNDKVKAAPTNSEATSSTKQLQGESNSPSNTASGEIPRRPLGRTGVQVSALGLGGATLGQAKSLEEAIRITHEAIDAG